MSKICVVIPFKPSLHGILRARAFTLASALPKFNPDHEFTLIFDAQHEPPQLSDSTAWSKVCRVRNRVVDTLFGESCDFSHILWIDADVVQYPMDMPTKLIEVNPNGVTSPLVLTEDMGNWFYDTAATGLKHEPPYWPVEPTTELADVDCTGTIVMMPAHYYFRGIRHEDHPTRTDWWPICQFALEREHRVCIHRGVVARHANLPKYGEPWH